MAPSGNVRTAGIGRVVVTGLVTALLYSALSTGSTAVCAGGSDENASGSPTTTQPLCLSVTFHPQTWVLLLLAALVIVAAAMVGRRTPIELTRRITTIAALAIVAIGITATLATFPLFYYSAVTAWQGGPAPHFWFDAVTSVTRVQQN